MKTIISNLVDKVFSRESWVIALFGVLVILALAYILPPVFIAYFLGTSFERGMDKAIDAQHYEFSELRKDLRRTDNRRFVDIDTRPSRFTD